MINSTVHVAILLEVGGRSCLYARRGVWGGSWLGHHRRGAWGYSYVGCSLKLFQNWSGRLVSQSMARLTVASCFYGVA